MTKGRKRSSRARMKTRLRLSRGAQALGMTVVKKIVDRKTVDVYQANRVKRRTDAAWKRGESGRAARDEQKKRRMSNQVAVRRQLRKLRRECRKLAAAR